ncbi:hypothetical protein OROHE_025561 [Orobanche hederae]
MRMDVDGQTNLPEARTTDSLSFSSNYRSQSRKISIGILADCIPKTDANDIKEAVIQIAENGSSSKGNCVKDGEQHTPVVEKHRTAVQDTSPWFSTKSFNQKISSASAVHNTEHTPSLLASSRPRPKSKLLEKASAAHSVKFFAGKTGLESEERREKNLGNAAYSIETGKVNNAEHADDPVRSTVPEVMLEKEQVEDKTRKTETGGCETLRMKLWEVLGNVSSPNSGSQSMELHPDKRDGKQSPIEKNNPNSDTIESDSEKLTSRIPTTRSLTRKRASTKNRHLKVVPPKSTCPTKGCSDKTMFPPREDCSRKLYGNFNDCSLPFMRNKGVRLVPGGDAHQVHNHESAEERPQSKDRSRSVPVVEKLMVHGNKVFKANSFIDRRTDVLVEPKSGIKKKNSKSSLDARTEKHKDVEQPIDVTIKLKGQQEDKRHSLLRNKRNSVENPSTPSFENKSHGCLPERKQGKLQSPGEKIFNTKGIRSFQSLQSSIPSEHNPNMQVESSDDGCKLHYDPLMKPIREDSENRVSKSSTDTTDSESSKDDSLMKGCRESKKLSPEICMDDDFQHGPNRSLGHEKDVEVTGCSPVEESLKGIQDSSRLKMYGKQNHEDSLASAVALFTVALDRVKTKLKSVSNKRSAEIVRAAAENIYVLLQDAESQIKTDVGKLNNLSQLKRKRLETRFQEQQEQLLGIYKKFKEDVDQHLQDYSGVIEDLEEHEIELKRYVERQRVAHRKSLSQVEQEIKTQLDDAESRIMGVQELAKEKMLQLKFVVAQSVKHGTFG